MANYVSNATVNLNVNGKQAQQMLDSFRKKLDQLRDEEKKALAAGDGKALKRITKEIAETEKVIKQLQSSSSKAADVLKNLDKATPKELRKTLKDLKQQLNGIERGSEAWNAQTEKIRKVKQALADINKEISLTQSGGSSFMHFIERQITGFTVLLGHITGAISKIREFVQDYADIQAEEANVIKYTGMSEGDVKRLNDEFRKIDTRTGREDLNRLAQEAGRLGKTSVEDVLGFVRAADQINVALDDLGDGATLTLSKLTSIFGVEEKLGTERSLLAVGSVINELSQNCTASAPYLAEFSKRLAGVGAQAKMTIPQIMAYAAVLDSQGQNVEASATALSQLVAKMYKDPAKIAKAAGMDVKEFTAILMNDANAALLKLLETLNSYGGMDKLATIFADMGADGARSTAVIAALAGKVEMLKWEQLEANQAFEQANSVTAEFSVQNSTVQARLDKSNEKFKELRRELGEKLMPVMDLLLVSGSGLIKAASATIGFVEKYIWEIVSLAAGVAAYTLVVKGCSMATAAWGGICKGVQAVAAATRATVLLLRVAYFHLTNQTTKAAAATRMFNRVCKASPMGILAGLIATVIGALISWKIRTDEARKAMEEARQEEEKWKKSLTDISDATAQACAAEEQKMKSLYETAIDQAKSTDERRRAAERLQQLYPDYFKNLSTEDIMLGRAKDSYDKLRESILKTARARAAAEKIKENEKDILALEEDLENEKREKTKREQEYFSAVVARDEAEEKHRNALNGSALGDSREMNSRDTQRHVHALNKATEAVSSASKKVEEANTAVKTTSEKIATLSTANKTLAKKYEVSMTDLDDEATPDSSDTVNAPTSQKALKEAEKERKKREAEAKRTALKARKEFKDALKQIKGDRDAAEAQAMIARQTGAIDYRQYLQQMREAEEKFYKDSEDLYKTWNLTEDADFEALQKKKLEATEKYNSKKLLLDKEARQREAKAEEMAAKWRYESKSNKSLTDEIAYEEELFRIRYDELSDLQQMYKDTLGVGSKEYAEYEQKLTDLLASNMEEKRRKLMAKTAEFQKQFDKLTIAEKYKLEYEALDELRKRKMISEQQYIEWRAKLRKKEKEELPGKRSDTSKAKADAAQKKYDEDKAELDKALAEGQITQDEYSARIGRLKADLNSALLEPLKNCKSEWVSMVTTMADSWMQFAEALKDPEGDPFTALANGITATAALMGAVMEQITQFTQAEMEIQKAAVEKRYDREISLAEGNAYLQKKLAKKKEDEIARMKEEASKKQFAMQIIATVAQTAANAVQAYGAALQVGPAGLVLAPIAAALAVAQGAVQIALLKKQQQAAASTGYSAGGFTKEGAVDEPAGIVHAGEWVASQRLVKNPKVRPILDVLERAQRTNRIGSITMEDVSRSVSAPMTLAYASQSQPQIVAAPAAQTSQPKADPALSDAISRLNRRLDLPIIAHSSVTGPNGSLEAKRKYDRLMSNKSRNKRS